MAPPLLVVSHATLKPGIDSLVAGAVAEALGGERLALFRARGAAFAEAGAEEHVAPRGTLEPNGMLWLERAGPARMLDGPAEGDFSRPALLSLNPALLGEDAAAAFEDGAGGRTVRLTVTEAAGGFAVFLGHPADGCRAVALPLARDGFGRLPPPARRDVSPELLAAFDMPGRNAARDRPGAAGGGPRIAIVGRAEHLIDVYPAVLASLGDASDRLGLSPTIRCIPHEEHGPADWDDVLAGADGLLLPGGSDMSQAEGQIAAAAAALRRDLPTLGLCLGMQTMATAFLRQGCGFEEANLEETAPAAPVHAFIRLRAPDGAPLHYLGEHPVEIREGTLLAALYGDRPTAERLNHRHHLNPALIPILAEAGLEVGAVSPGSGVAQAVEAPGKRFFLGIQGHPELRSRRGAPHPAMAAFLGTVACDTATGS